MALNWPMLIDRIDIFTRSHRIPRERAEDFKGWMLLRWLETNQPINSYATPMLTFSAKIMMTDMVQGQSVSRC